MSVYEKFIFPNQLLCYRLVYNTRLHQSYNFSFHLDSTSMNPKSKGLLTKWGFNQSEKSLADSVLGLVVGNPTDSKLIKGF